MIENGMSSALCESGPETNLELLFRALDSGRVAHAYLFTGDDLRLLEELARKYVAALECTGAAETGTGSGPGPRRPCRACHACMTVATDKHPDVHWVRPTSRLRLILIDQMRELMREIYLKPGPGRYKVGVISGAECMTADAANAFLKTLEEPPPRSVLILLSTEPHRLLETVRSRCLQLNFSGELARKFDSDRVEWVRTFAEQAANTGEDILSRYQLLSLITLRLDALKKDMAENIEREMSLGTESDKTANDESERQQKGELAARIESAYRFARAELMRDLIRWFRDVWLTTLGADRTLLFFPELDATGRVAARLSLAEALENIQILDRAHRLLYTNVQELLILEVAVMQLRLGRTK